MTAQAEETLIDDDLCPMCHMLLYIPVKTACNHVFCSSCMAHWADISVSNMAMVSLDDTATDFSPSTVEATCPMCRQNVPSKPDTDLAAALQGRYPSTYAQRAKEEEAEGNLNDVETITVYIGNTHELIRAAPGSENCHEWVFFVRLSRTDNIAGVRIMLHPTFRPPEVTRTEPPFEVRRRGWGYFTIDAEVVLKRGYEWVSRDAGSLSSGLGNRSLPLSWTLDFDGSGSQGRCRLKVRRVNEVQAEVVEGDDDDDEMDGDWETDDDDDDDDDIDDDELESDDDDGADGEAEGEDRVGETRHHDIDRDMAVTYGRLQAMQMVFEARQRAQRGEP